MYKQCAFLFICFLFACKSDHVVQKKAIIHLLQDTSLSHMQKRGGNAVYELKDGILTGYSKFGTPNTFLCTKDMYKDIILDFQVFIDPRLNSGVQIRSDSVNVKGRETVAGLQVEIDPSDRAWSGGIYEENRRGWIHSLAHNEKARKAFKNNTWNAYHIEAIGNSIRVWVNGINTTNLLDTASLAGLIGFQVHAIGDESKEGAKVQWKDIRLITSDFEKHRIPIQDSDPELNLLPNVLSERETEQGWVIPNKDIVGNSKTAKRVTLANSEGDFELKLEYKVNKLEAAAIEYGQDLKGQPMLEYAILDDIHFKNPKQNSQKTGGLLGKLEAQNLSNPERDKPVRNFDQWSQVHIIYKNGDVQHYLNNSLVLDYAIKDIGNVRPKKTIFFKNKGGGAYLRSIKLRNL